MAYGEKTRCNETMTEAQFVSKIKGILRSESRKWKPFTLAKQLARVSRGIYRCNMCKKMVRGTVKVPGKRKPAANIDIDHIDPIISTETGFTTWDSFINNLFCEVHALQILCKPCHKKKCDIEKQEAKEARARRKREANK